MKKTVPGLIIADDIIFSPYGFFGFLYSLLDLIKGIFVFREQIDRVSSCGQQTCKR
jgi:hypothetical protein